MYKPATIGAAIFFVCILLVVSVRTLLNDDPTPPTSLAPGTSNSSSATAITPNIENIPNTTITTSEILQKEIFAREQLAITVARLEKELLELKMQFESRTALGTSTRTTATQKNSLAPTPVLDDQSLRDAGLSNTQVTQVRERFEQLEMDRLYLKDRANREGWMGTVRYSNEVTKLEETRLEVRNNLGDVGYDAYLYATDQPNRVVISETLQGSPAKQAGIQPGDMVLRYGDKRVFTARELQNATAGGQSGEMVRVEIERDGKRMDIYVPRGPLGVYLGTDSAKP